MKIGDIYLYSKNDAYVYSQIVGLSLEDVKYVYLDIWLNPISGYIRTQNLIEFLNIMKFDEKLTEQCLIKQIVE